MRNSLRLISTTFILAIFAVSTVSVQAEDYTYTANNGTITITGYTGLGGAVSIPSTINGLPVTSIGANAFWGTSLTSVTIGTNVTSIGSWAFGSCHSLTNVTIGNGVTNIGRDAFRYCNSLIVITVDTNNPAYSSVVGVLFDKNQTTLIQYPAGKVGTSYSIPNIVTNIVDWAFYGCASLTNITIGNSVISIGDSAFFDCFNLASVVIGNSVISIGGYAFFDCSSLTAITVDTNNPAYSSVVGVLFDKNQTTLIQYPAGKVGTSYSIPNSVTNIVDWALYGCASLASVTIGTNVASIGGEVFRDCTSLTSITIPNSVTSLGDTAFYGCTSLTNIMIPNSVTSLGEGTFSHCTNLASVTIGNSVTNIGGWSMGWPGAFFFCTSLTSITIPNSVTSIGGGAFAYCTSLTNATIGNGVTDIGGWGDGGVFAFCTSLTAITVDVSNPAYSSVDGVVFNKSQTTLVQYLGGRAGSYMIPNSVTSIEGNAFYGCTSLTSVTIPNNVTSIGYWAFYGCTSLTSVTIPNSVSNIGDGAFYRCTSLTDVTIGNSVTSIGYWAFYDCASLDGIYFQGNAPSVGEYAFYDTPGAIVYYLPGTTGWDTTFGGRPTSLWFLPNPLILNNGLSFGVRTNAFGFIISWATNRSVVVEASQTLVTPTWVPISTNTLSNGSLYFSDPQWTNYPGRFYRLRSP